MIFYCLPRKKRVLKAIEVHYKYKIHKEPCQIPQKIIGTHLKYPKRTFEAAFDN